MGNGSRNECSLRANKIVLRPLNSEIISSKLLRCKSIKRIVHKIRSSTSVFRETAGIVASSKIASSTDRRFCEIYCEQMEANLKNLEHGFSSEQTHLAKLRWISPKNDGFQDIFRVLWTRFWQLRPATKCLFPGIRLLQSWICFVFFWFWFI